LKEGIVLFAHGSREPGWAEPFERISRELERRCPGVPVKLAYLEMMKPSLGEAIASLAAAGARRVRVVPAFLGAGGHIKHDLPKLAAAARTRHPALEIVLEKTIGERPETIAALAAVISKGFSDQTRS
jgi:sirohydrochlorin cobaltochelatase